MKRREFIVVLGSAAAWPMAARGQQAGMPVVGILSLGSAAGDKLRIGALKDGLSQSGYVEGQNITVEYRYAESQFDRLPALAEELIRRKPAVIHAAGPPSVRAIKVRTATIPIVFEMGEDPVKEGLVESLNRPGGNITGIGGFANVLFPKRLQLLHEIVPRPAPLALLVNPNNPNATPDSESARMAAVALGRELIVLTAGAEQDIDAVFVALVRQRVGGLIVGVDGLFGDRRDQIFALTARHAIPVIYERREFPLAGGLMSYGTDSLENYRQCGIYMGRILKGERPGDLPVLQATKFEFVIISGSPRFSASPFRRACSLLLTRSSNESPSLISLLGAAACPIAARGQQRVPVVGFLDSLLTTPISYHIAAFRQGLNENGLVEARQLVHGS